MNLFFDYKDKKQFDLKIPYARFMFKLELKCLKDIFCLQENF